MQTVDGQGAHTVSSPGRHFAESQGTGIIVLY